MAQTNVTKTGSGKLLLFAILFTAFQLTGIVLTTIISGFQLSWILISAVMAVLCFMMYITYRSHDKNVMKPLLGAALMLMLCYELLNWGGMYLQHFGEVLEYFGKDNVFAVYAITKIVTFFVLAAINVIHYLINYTHHSSPGKVTANRVLCTVFVVLVVIQAVCLSLAEDGIAMIIADCLCAVSDVFMLAIVVNIESKLDAFRIARETEA